MPRPALLQLWSSKMIHALCAYQPKSIGIRPRMGVARLAALALGAIPSIAFGADKPPLAPDTVAPFSTNSRLSAGIEFGLPSLAADIERDIPQRLASIDESAMRASSGSCSGSTPIVMSGAMWNGPAASRSRPRRSRLRFGADHGVLGARAPTASRPVSTARRRPAPPSKPRRVRSSAGTGRSTSISATGSDGASRRCCT